MAKTKMPKGWRRLQENELIIPQDRIWSDIGEFFEAACVGVIVKHAAEGVRYVRRVPAKPKKKSLKPSPILFSQEDFEENLTVARKRGHSRTNEDKKKPVAGKLPRK